MRSPQNYRRWWNSSWYTVEEGGEPDAGNWTPADSQRLRALVDHAHTMGYWVRFYALDGFCSRGRSGLGAGLQLRLPRGCYSALESCHRSRGQFYCNESVRKRSPPISSRTQRNFALLLRPPQRSNDSPACHQGLLNPRIWAQSFLLNYFMGH